MDNFLLEKNDKRVVKCLKSYLTAKKYYDSDIDKSMEYFKQCIKILNDIRDKNIKIKDDIINLIDETETECTKYLTKAIELTIEKPLKIPNFKPDNDNELFEIIEIGAIDKLKKYNYGELNYQIYNEQGLTPLHCAIKYGDTSFIKNSLKLGACIDQTNKFGHTLLEFACLEKDPNMINFLSSYGADMKKHLLFREGKKYFNNGNQIDLMVLQKMIMEVGSPYDNLKYLEFIFEYLKPDEPIELEYSDQKNSTISIGKIKTKEFIKKLDNLLDTFNKEKRDTYLQIIKEELAYELPYKLGCPSNKLEILLYNLVPFIEYDNLKINWIISLEVKYLILKILKNKVKINTPQLKKELTDLLYESYIKNQILPEGLIQTIVLQWLYKIKV
jgi:ankyrin repeat protein